VNLNGRKAGHDMTPKPNKCRQKTQQCMSIRHTTTQTRLFRASPNHHFLFTPIRC